MKMLPSPKKTLSMYILKFVYDYASILNVKCGYL